jgi:hypothetical protein
VDQIEDIAKEFSLLTGVAFRPMGDGSDTGVAAPAAA